MDIGKNGRFEVKVDCPEFGFGSFTSKSSTLFLQTVYVLPSPSTSDSIFKSELFFLTVSWDGNFKS